MSSPLTRSVLCTRKRTEVVDGEASVIETSSVCKEGALASKHERKMGVVVSKSWSGPSVILTSTNSASTCGGADGGDGGGDGVGGGGVVAMAHSALWSTGGVHWRAARPIALTTIGRPARRPRKRLVENKSPDVEMLTVIM